MSIPKRLRRTVAVVCSDLYSGFINAAKEVFGKKIMVVADRFHVARLYRDGLESLRKKEMKRLKETLPEATYRRMKNVMWILRKPKSQLTSDERRILRIVFRHSLELKRAYELMNRLTDIFNGNSGKGLAKRKIKGWMRQVKNSGLNCFNKFLGTLDNHMEEISNYFVNRDNSGFVEGMNAKLKVIKRRCYGLSNIGHFFQRIFLDFEGYKIFKYQ